MRKFNYKLEIEIFRNSTQNILGVLRGSFQGFGCPKRHPDALLAKTMGGTVDMSANYYNLIYIFSFYYLHLKNIYLNKF